VCHFPSEFHGQGNPKRAFATGTKVKAARSGEELQVRQPARMKMPETESYVPITIREIVYSSPFCLRVLIRG
jgi:hypothetical protein